MNDFGLPIIDLQGSPNHIGAAIDAACRGIGFFLVTGHGVDPALIDDLTACSRTFFARPDADKAQVAMAKGGTAWRGWFPLGGELTSGVPDGKEGIYFGTELDANDPRVRAQVPLHGPNQFPNAPREMRDLVLTTIDALTAVGARVLEGIAVGLRLNSAWFEEHLTTDPTILFRIFRYPPDRGDFTHGVAEHTDYGLVTVLAHDGTPGLQVRTPHGWIDAPTTRGAFVINVGDMLEKLTGGRYRSTPHRVRNSTEHDRYSFPLFYDPSWDAQVTAVPIADEDARPSQGRRDPNRRWDNADPVAWEGRYGDYLTAKVARVFPELFDRVINADAANAGGAPER